MYHTTAPIERGHWISIEGVFLVVERIVPAKPRDPWNGIALCKPGMG